MKFIILIAFFSYTFGKYNFLEIQRYYVMCLCIQKFTLVISLDEFLNFKLSCFSRSRPKWVTSSTFLDYPERPFQQTDPNGQ